MRLSTCLRAHVIKNLRETCRINTPKLVTCGLARLRGLVPEQHDSEKTSQPASLLVPLEKAVNGITPPWCGR